MWALTKEFGLCVFAAGITAYAAWLIKIIVWGF